MFLLGFGHIVSAQYSHQNYYQQDYRWKNFNYQEGDLHVDAPQGYQYSGLRSSNNNYYAQFYYDGQYYQQPIHWQQNNGRRVAKVILSVVGSTLLNISNELQWGSQNYYQQPYFYQNSPPVYYQNNYRWRRR